MDEGATPTDGYLKRGKLESDCEIKDWIDCLPMYSPPFAIFLSSKRVSGRDPGPPELCESSMTSIYCKIGGVFKEKV